MGAIRVRDHVDKALLGRFQRFYDSAADAQPSQGERIPGRAFAGLGSWIAHATDTEVQAARFEAISTIAAALCCLSSRCPMMGKPRSDAHYRVSEGRWYTSSHNTSRKQ